MSVNTIKIFNNNIFTITVCPLCKSKKNKLHSKCKKNLYSEFLSKILNVHEETLIKYIFNKECKKCGLIYKNYWFKDKILKILFLNSLPIHPKGNDIHSNIFSKKNFYKEYLNLKKYYNKDFSLYNKSKRTLLSIIFATDTIQKNKNNISSTLNHNKLNFKMLEKKVKKFSFYINKPLRFSRFLGYNDNELWNLLKKKIKKIESYAETGCPSWGLLKKAKQEKKQIFFLKRKENNFWNEEKGCLKKSKLNKKEIITSFRKLKKISLFAIIQYLDHLNNPLYFIKKIDNSSKNFYVITENTQKMPVAIQHFSGWSKKSLTYLAFQINKKVIIYENYFKPKKEILAVYANNLIT